MFDPENLHFENWAWWHMLILPVLRQVVALGLTGQPAYLGKLQARNPVKISGMALEARRLRLFSGYHTHLHTHTHTKTLTRGRSKHMHFLQHPERGTASAFFHRGRRVISWPIPASLGQPAWAIQPP